MEFRIATLQELPQIKSMYKEITKHMEDNQIRIWDDIYPCEFFQEDIEEQRLYLMAKGDEIISCVALCRSNLGEHEVAWEERYAKAWYLERLGVNIRYIRQGIGSLTLSRAKEAAKSLGAEYLRLFVIESNIPAIRLYEKNGFVRAEGMYHTRLDEDTVFHEYGYEIQL